MRNVGIFTNEDSEFAIYAQDSSVHFSDQSTGQSISRRGSSSYFAETIDGQPFSDIVDTNSKDETSFKIQDPHDEAVWYEVSKETC